MFSKNKTKSFRSLTKIKPNKVSRPKPVQNTPVPVPDPIVEKNSITPDFLLKKTPTTTNTPEIQLSSNDKPLLNPPPQNVVSDVQANNTNVEIRPSIPTQENVVGSPVVSLLTTENVSMLPGNGHKSTAPSSVISDDLQSMLSYSKTNSVYKEKKRKFQNKLTGGVFDRKDMTMFDLIVYNPPNNPMPNRDRYTHVKKKNRSRPSVNNSVVDDSEAMVDTPDDVSPASVNSQSNESGIDTNDKESSDLKNEGEESEEDYDPLAPQMKIGPNGEIIIDEKSMMIKQTVDEERVRSIQNNVREIDEYTLKSYTKERKRAQDWTKNETAHFYKALSSVGTDFSLMKDMFFKTSSRSRSDLKLKFKKEEKFSKVLIESALSDCSQYDLTVFEDKTGE